MALDVTSHERLEAVAGGAMTLPVSSLQLDESAVVTRQFHDWNPVGLIDETKDSPSDPRAYTAPDNAGAGVDVFLLDSRDTWSPPPGVAVAEYRDFVIGAVDPPKGGPNLHGSHMAQLISGFYWGVAPHVTLHWLRVADDAGLACSDDVRAAIQYVAQTHVARRVVNLSMSGPRDPDLNEAIADLVRAGGAIVVAAGDNRPSSVPCISPASAVGVVTVGAWASDNRAELEAQTFGSGMDVYAPGQGLTVFDCDGTRCVEAESLGTSPAAAISAGAIALWWSEVPMKSASEVVDDFLRCAPEDLDPIIGREVGTRRVIHTDPQGLCRGGED